MTHSDFAPDDARAGRWGYGGLSGVLGAHAALLHTGKVLFFTRPEEPSHKLSELDNGFPGDLAERCSASPDDTADDCPPQASLGSLVDVLGPGPFQPRPTTIRKNPFCSGHAFLPDGRLLVAGGDKKTNIANGAPIGTQSGLRALRAFDPVSETWQDLGRMSSGRWYPFCATLPDGAVLIISGSLDDQQPNNNMNPTCETSPPMLAGPQFLPFLAEAWPQHSFPPTYVLPDRSVYVFACNRANYLRPGRDGAGVDRWLVEEGAAIAGQAGKLYPNSSTSVLLPLRPTDGYRAETVVFGGGGADEYPYGHLRAEPASRSCLRLVLGEAGAAWRRGRDMPAARTMADAVLLPDGAVLVLNGATAGYAGGNAAEGVAEVGNAVLAPDLYDPVSNCWTTLTATTIPRLYHSTALLLPDATVLVAGSDQQRHSRDPEGSRRAYRAGAYEYRLERFFPPYMASDRRPIIESAPDSIEYGEPFTIAIADSGLSREHLQVVLVAPSSVTHGANMSQRLVELRLLGPASAELELLAPPDGWVAPPGYYMLFVLCEGVPSVAKFVRVGSPTATPVFGLETPPSNMAAWFRADRNVSLAPDGAVVGWGDLSGRGVDLTVESAGGAADQAPPLTVVDLQINGRPVLSFPLVVDPANWNNLVGRFLRSNGAPFAPGDGPYLIALVARPWPPGHRIFREGEGGDCSDLVGWGDFGVPDDNGYVALRMSSGPRRGDFPIHRGTASIHSYWRHRWRFGDQNAIPREQLVKLDGAMLIEAEFDGRDIAIRINRREIKRDPDSRATRDGQLWIGRNGPEGAYYRGDIAEVVIYDRLLAAEERAELYQYVNTRYALW